MKFPGKFGVLVVDFAHCTYPVAMVLTYRYRIKDANRRHLQRQAWAVNHGNVNAGGLARTRLAKSVLDAGWSQLRSQLHYKAVRHGVEYIEVDERLTTQVCSACGARGGPQGREDLVVREWICGGCGAWHDRDINSAINILVSGRNVGLQRTEIPSLK